MRFFSVLLWLLSASFVRANVKAVFAHFMVSNTATYTLADWTDDITLARDAKIDGFVLNMGKDEVTNGASLQLAFNAANNLGSTFKLLFSFDYAGNGLWEKAKVIALINQYSGNAAYYKRGSQPLVSTFEGPKASPDWPSIKAATGCFFIPSWSSLGAKPAWDLGTADGLFSWAAWPTGPNNMDTFTDASYLDTLAGKPYMMGVSPWFYTNMPGFRKNWLWRGDSLWYDRWINVFFLQPEYVQIITWNDFGESHHIGPLKDKAFEAFTRGRSPYNYAAGKPHDGWRTLLPYLIDVAKTNTTSFTTEKITAWYRPHPKNACGSGGTTGNTASQLQPVFPPGELIDDAIFYTAVLASAATVSVSVGGVALAGTWTYVPSDGKGLYYGKVSFGSLTGAVVITITRSGATIVSATGPAITTSCTSEMQNYNPYVISGISKTVLAPVVPLSLAVSGCTSGYGDKKYRNLCTIACRYDYCPRGACTCTSIGAKITRPTPKNLFACPAPGIDTTYLGLCAFVCNYAECPDVCKIVPANTVCVAPLPVAPPIPVCVAGMADGAYATMCSFSCALGFCPPEICTCTRAGTSGPASPPISQVVGSAKGAEDYGLCAWACKRGVCPTDLCTCVGTGCPGGSSPGSAPGGVFFQPTNSLIIRGVKGELAEGCRVANECTDQNDFGSSSCFGGERKIGWDKDFCTKPNFGLSICCPVRSILNQEDCSWNNGPANPSWDNEPDDYCNGSCSAGSVTVVKSVWGDGSGPRCIRGTKAFCCKSPTFTQAFAGCKWTSCDGEYCSKFDLGIASAYVTCPSGSSHQERAITLCCPPDTPFHDCHWKGQAPDCDDSACSPDEVTISHGDERAFASVEANKKCSRWAASESLCCKILVPKPPVETPPLTCSSWSICQDHPTGCFVETSDENEVDPFAVIPRKRHLHGHSQYHHPHQLDTRARTSTTTRPVAQGQPRLLLNQFHARPYWGAGRFIVRFAANGWDIEWFIQGARCLQLVRTITTASNSASIPPDVLHSEHLLDLQTIMQFAEFTITGTLANTNVRSTLFYLPHQRISGTWWDSTFTRPVLPAGIMPPVTGVPNSPAGLLRPEQRIYEIIGSTTNPRVMVLLEAWINMIKGFLITASTPLTIDNFRARVDESILDPTVDINRWLRYIVDSVAVFQYVNTPSIANTFAQIINDIGLEFDVIDNFLNFGAMRLGDRWEEFIGLFLVESATFAQGYVRDLIGYAMREYGAHPQHPDSFRILVILRDAEDEVDNMVWPGYPI